jgi:hypothetical protein
MDTSLQLCFSATLYQFHNELLYVTEEKSFSSIFSIRKTTMKKIQASQARAVVGGGFFSSLVKISTGGLLASGDPVAAATAIAVGGGAASRGIAKMALR